jgi:hypothetical protein
MDKIAIMSVIIFLILCVLFLWLFLYSIIKVLRSSINKVSKIVCILFIISSAVLLVLFFVIKIPLLENDYRLYGTQISASVNESKNKGLFVSEYNFYPNTITAESKHYEIKEIWVEKCWLYKDEKNAEKKSWINTVPKTEDLTIKKTGGEQMLITFSTNLINEEGLRPFDFSRIKRRPEDNIALGCSGCGWINDIIHIGLEKDELTKDTITFYFFNQKDTVQVNFVKKQGNRKF